jgi:hypothetical protein
MFQIRDWLTLEEAMLRQQIASVGDVTDILQLLDKQKVSVKAVFLVAPSTPFCAPQHKSATRDLNELLISDIPSRENNVYFQAKTHP